MVLCLVDNWVLTGRQSTCFCWASSSSSCIALANFNRSCTLQHRQVPLLRWPQWILAQLAQKGWKEDQWSWCIWSYFNTALQNTGPMVIKKERRRNAHTTELHWVVHQAHITYMHALVTQLSQFARMKSHHAPSAWDCHNANTCFLGM